jgi:hypothetical protein
MHYVRWIHRKYVRLIKFKVLTKRVTTTCLEHQRDQPRERNPHHKRRKSARTNLDSRARRLARGRRRCRRRRCRRVAMQRKLLEVLEVVGAGLDGVDREDHAGSAMADLTAISPDRRRLRLGKKRQR